MKEKEIYDKITKLRQNLKSNKFLGAMTTEVIKDYLNREGFNVSERDSFVKGVPNEIDLLVLKKNAKPIFNSYYDAFDVLAAFEIKFRGGYGKSNIRTIKKLFKNIRMVNSKIRCIYLTISENQKYKYKITTKNVNCEVFKLFKRFTSSIERAIEKGEFNPSGDWERLISYLKKCQH